MDGDGCCDVGVEVGSVESNRFQVRDGGGSGGELC